MCSVLGLNPWMPMSDTTMPAKMSDEEMMGPEEMLDCPVGPGFKPVLHSHRHNLRNRFELGKTLGEGMYGKVKLAVEKGTGEKVAIKYIKKNKVQDDTDLRRLRREIHVMSSLSHPNIINIREVFENKDKIILVMDCALGGELYDYINDRQKLTENSARRLFRQISSAINYCHQNGIVHRDLKLENIVLDIDENVKIADFGLSNFYSKDTLLKTFCGSPLYASPEIVNGQPYYGPEVDCWSLGVILYTLVYGAMPFEGTDFKTLRKQISNGDYFEPNTPSEAAGLIRHLLTVNPKKRAKMSDILNHWWVNLGYKETPIGEQYPSNDMLNTYKPRCSPCLSSDSEGEGDQVKPVQPLKGILKKPKTSYSSTEEVGEEEQTVKVPLQPVKDDNTAYMVMPEEGPNVTCDNNSENNNSIDDKKVFDSEKKPARGILKRKGKFSGGDSGCILNESGAKSPGSDTKENNSMLYDLSDIDNVLNTTDRSPTETKNKFTYPENVVESNNNTTVVVVPRRSILKKGGQTDPRKRLSACSTGSNSSADILDFSYDSGDDNYETISNCPQMEREGSLVGTPSFEDMNSAGDMLNTITGTPQMYENDNEFYNTEAARELCDKAKQIVNDVQLDSQ